MATCEEKLERIKKFHYEYESVFGGFQLKDNPELAELIRFEYRDKFDKLKAILTDNQ